MKKENTLQEVQEQISELQEEREIVTITSLLTLGGCEPQLEVHINGSLNVGISPEKIIETFIQCIPYVGFPKVLNATFVAKKIFSERNLTLGSNTNDDHQ